MMTPRDTSGGHFRAIAAAALWIAAASGCAPEVDRPSLLLLTLDTTRADRLGVYGREQAGTRHLDALAEEGALFQWAFTSVPMTLPAHATILTGTHPFRHGIRENGVQLPNADLVLLAEILQQADYRTAAFVSAFPLYEHFGLAGGFEVYDDDIDRPQNTPHPAKQRLADEVVGVAIEWLDTLDPDDRFFLWVHFFDPHAEYLPPQPYATWYRSDPYQGEIAYMDEWIGKLLGHLAESGRAEDTLVVAVGDHGEGLGQHGERTHAELVYNSTMHVPLILSGAGIEPGQRVLPPVGIVDLLPTLLDLLSLDVPDQAQGISLVPLLSGAPPPNRSLYFETFYPRTQHGWSELQGVVSEGWKYIEAPAARSGELFRLSADPEELHDRSAEQPIVAKRLAGELAAFRQREGSIPPEASPQQLSAEVRRELEALGYLTAGAEPPAEGARHPRDMVEIATAFVDAHALIERGDLSRAEPLVAKIVRDDPDSLAAHQIRGRYLLALGESDPEYLPGALEELQAALAVAPESAFELRFVAEAYFALDDWPVGLQYFARAAAAGPMISDLQRDYRSVFGDATERARELAAAGESGRALKLLDAVAALEPEDAAVARRAEDLRREIQRD